LYVLFLLFGIFLLVFDNIYPLPLHLNAPDSMMWLLVLPVVLCYTTPTLGIGFSGASHNPGLLKRYKSSLLFGPTLHSNIISSDAGSRSTALFPWMMITNNSRSTLCRVS
jgi:hypothetical protein